jgi:hypothetical protein
MSTLTLLCISISSIYLNSISMYRLHGWYSPLLYFPFRLTSISSSRRSHYNSGQLSTDDIQCNSMAQRATRASSSVVAATNREFDLESTTFLKTKRETTSTAKHGFSAFSTELCKPKECPTMDWPHL